MIRLALLSLALVLASEGCVQAKGPEHIRTVGRDPRGGARIDAVTTPLQAGDPREAARKSGLVDLPRFPSISPQPAGRREAARGPSTAGSAPAGRFRRPPPGRSRT